MHAKLIEGGDQCATKFDRRWFPLKARAGAERLVIQRMCQLHAFFDLLLI